MNNDPIFNIPMCLICINDNSVTVQTLQSVKDLDMVFFENSSLFVLFF